MDAPNEFQPLMDEIFRDKVLRARQQSAGEKILLGIELFETAVKRMRGGIRAQFPAFSEEEVETELQRRFDRVRQVEEHGFFTTVPPA